MRARRPRSHHWSRPLLTLALSGLVTTSGPATAAASSLPRATHTVTYDGFHTGNTWYRGKFTGCSPC
jgi:hypothetical protein